MDKRAIVVGLIPNSFNIGCNTDSLDTLLIQLKTKASQNNVPVEKYSIEAFEASQLIQKLNNCAIESLMSLQWKEFIDKNQINIPQSEDFTKRRHLPQETAAVETTPSLQPLKISLELSLVIQPSPNLKGSANFSLISVISNEYIVIKQIDDRPNLVYKATQSDLSHVKDIVAQKSEFGTQIGQLNRQLCEFSTQTEHLAEREIIKDQKAEIRKFRPVFLNRG